MPLHRNHSHSKLSNSQIEGFCGFQRLAFGILGIFSALTCQCGSENPLIC